MEKRFNVHDITYILKFNDIDATTAITRATENIYVWETFTNEEVTSRINNLEVGELMTFECGDVVDVIVKRIL